MAQRFKIKYGRILFLWLQFQPAGVWCAIFILLSSPGKANASEIHPFLLDEPIDNTSGESSPGDTTQILSHTRFLLRDQAEVGRSRIYLEDVAKCESVDNVNNFLATHEGAQSLSLCEEANAIDLGSAPPAGRTIRLTKSGIVDILRRELPGKVYATEGPETLRISSPAVEVDRTGLHESLSAALGEILPGEEGVRVRVDRIQVIAPTKVRPGGVRFEFPSLKNLRNDIFSRVIRNSAGAISVEALLLSEKSDEDAQKLTLSVLLLVERQTVVAANDLTAGAVLGPADLKVDWVAAKLSAQRGFRSIEPLVGLRVKRAIFMNSVIDGSAVERVNLVSRGEMVGLVFRSGDLEISAKVEALASAGVGDVIDVLNRDSKKRLRAKVVARNQVEAL